MRNALPVDEFVLEHHLWKSLSGRPCTRSSSRELSRAMARPESPGRARKHPPRRLPCKKGHLANNSLGTCLSAKNDPQRMLIDARSCVLRFLFLSDMAMLGFRACFDGAGVSDSEVDLYYPETS